MVDKQLKILTGEVKNLHYKNASKDFFNDNLQNKAGVAAIGAAAVGAFANAAVFTSISSNARDKVQIFSCSVNGIELSGCFGGVTFEEGDEIEFVVEYNPDNPKEGVVHAARDRKRKILSTLPYQDVGEKKFIKSSTSLAFGFSSSMVFLMILLLFITAWINGFTEFEVNFLIVMSVCALIGGGAIFWLFHINSRKLLPYAKNATRVLAVLGYKNPDYASPHHNNMDAHFAYIDEHNVKTDILPRWVNRYQDSDLEK